MSHLQVYPLAVAVEVEVVEVLLLLGMMKVLVLAEEVVETLA